MRPVVAIFAHPDDEAFGPSGTLAKLAKVRPVYLICLTDGAAGMNSSEKTEELAQIRREELLASAKLLGIQKVFLFHYPDGSLSNNLYHEIAKKLEKTLIKLEPEVLFTYELQGVSGHLDHIAVSLITTFVFEKLDSALELWYYCVSEKRREALKDYYIYFPPGKKKEEIEMTIDVSDVWDLKIQAMEKHESQAHDVERILKAYHGLPKEEEFIVLRK
jgi:N-acetylglucosamine malate deacetylase 2